MSQPKPNKQVIIDSIIKEIELGKERGETLSKVGAKWRISSRTFDRYWKSATEKHRIKRQSIEKAKLELDKQHELEARKKQLLSAEQRKELLTKIANGEMKIKKPFVISGKIMEYPAEPDHFDRMKAIAELNKMEGDYAPTKNALTDTEGKDLPVEVVRKIMNPKTGLAMTPEEVREYLAPRRTKTSANAEGSTA